MAVGSIVDYLKSQGKDSSYEARKQLAQQNGITGYSGTAAQNTALLKMLQSGSNAPGETTPQAVTSGNNGAMNTTVSSSGKTNQNTFKQSKQTKEYLNALKELEANKPDEFSSQYTDEINTILDGILGRKEFSYGSEELMNDSLYQMYRDNYMRQGDLAMRDTMGNAAALTGGYGSTYAQAAGQQAYDNYLANLNDMALQFADRAYQRYQDETADRYNQLSSVMGLDNTDYSRYRDTVDDYYKDLNYMNNRYAQEYGFDYDEYLNQISQQQWQQQFDFQQSEAARDQANWAAEFALAQQKAASGGGSGGTGRKSGSSGTNTEQERISWTQAKNKYEDILEKEGKQSAEDFMEYLEYAGLVDMYKQDTENIRIPKTLGSNVVEVNRNALDAYAKNELTDKWRKKWTGIK